MSNNLEKDFNLGGTVDQALSGQYQLKMGEVLREAWDCTLKHFLSFSPAIVMLIIIQVVIFFIALKLMIGDPSMILTALTQADTFPQEVVQGILIANFSYEVVSAPIYAGVSLMAMSHAAGLKTKTSQITKGLQFTIPVIMATLLSLLLQGIAGMIFPLLSMYFSLAFSSAILLICEKRVPPIQSLWISLRAVNKKLLPLAGIYALLMLMFVAAVLFYGIGLIFVLPFFFHVKGIIYRNMFGIRLKIIATHRPDNKDDNDSNSQVFNA
ncbi:hypothetical protein EXA23_00450 [Vibrio cincinnatiensis]|jgi:hypothetical protein|uniref:Proline and glycine rich transmembrane protein gene in bax n=1 Tax=Vibrio cincinnatiensis DSM 19608 TaxID=1123491 RepID=A0A1T4RKT4_VIBCI|nr:hypothetical protein [Vibrio cincinnatiensis]MCG3721360.1 hypothetical protein [Vibrio cincinnatiensis]MCG3725591.1 hypothetical protein [Vibrio cincinnatiensis]MCG3732086.1 hypothetical protein [Vibrio cincinnatiensis]MCG3736254.1 hypothetical protein [Vibrio cincinnatiensis]MCG3739797.1 hypothetical protein [Vibrio cincinnatiensis]